MSDHLGFNYGFNKSETPSGNSSNGFSGELVSPPPNNQQSTLNIPNNNNTNMNMKKEPEIFLLRSLDIKKQLSLSFQGLNFGSGVHGGGITKPQSRRNSGITIKSQPSDDEDEDEEAGVAKPRKKYNPANAAATATASGDGDGDDDDDDQGHERKRRDNINEKIQELLTLVPPEFFDVAPLISSAAGSGDVLEHDAAVAAAVKNSGTKDGKPNKGQILTKSVEYIQYLQKVIDENNRKEVELIMKLKSLELKKENKLNVPINVGHTSAEIALGEIGVGPLSDEYFKQVFQHSTKAPVGVTE